MMFGLANLLTAANLCCGIVSIIFTLSGRLDLAAMFLLFSVVADFADGFVARLTKTSGDLGKQLDSLADVVSFGVAPGIFMMVMILMVNLTKRKNGTILIQIVECCILTTRWLPHLVVSV